MKSKDLFTVLDEKILYFKNKLKSQEEGTKSTKEDLLCLEKAKQLCLESKFFKNKKKGPMSELDSTERIMKILEIIKVNGGVNVSIWIISRALELTREAVRAWMNRQINNGKAPWRYGKDMSHYSLINQSK